MEFVFDGGNLALDLINTRPLSGGEPVDLLPTVEQADAWLAEAGVLEPGSVTSLAARLQVRILADLLALRDVALAGLEAIVEDEPIPGDSVAVLNAILAARTETVQLSVEESGPIKRRLQTDREISGLIWPVAVAVVDLLVDVDPERVSQCDDDDCVIWFLDTSKNRSRRWCSMTRCGNRHKVAAHYQRKKAAE